MNITRNETDSWQDYTVTAGELAWHLTNQENPRVGWQATAMGTGAVRLYALYLHGRQLIHSTQLDYVLSIGTTDSESNWAGGGHGWESDHSAMSLLIDGEAASMSVGDIEKCSIVELSYTTYGYTESDETQTVRLEHKHRIEGGVYDYWITRTFIRDAYIFTEYCSMFTARGTDHGSAHYPCDKVTIGGTDYTGLGEKTGSSAYYTDSGTTTVWTDSASGARFTMVTDSSWDVLLADRTDKLVKAYARPIMESPGAARLNGASDSYHHQLTVDYVSEPVPPRTQGRMMMRNGVVRKLVRNG